MEHASVWSHEEGGADPFQPQTRQRLFRETRAPTAPAARVLGVRCWGRWGLGRGSASHRPHLPAPRLEDAPGCEDSGRQGLGVALWKGKSLLSSRTILLFSCWECFDLPSMTAAGRAQLKFHFNIC